MGSISYNPWELQELSKGYAQFDETYKKAREEIMRIVSDIENSWEGEDAETAKMELGKIEDSLARIDEKSTYFKNLIIAKDEGFNAIRF